MLQRIPKAATRVRSPKTSPNPPKNSAAIARKAKGAGMCRIPVKKPIVPVKPYPPNHPSIFCAPCAKKTSPSTNRRTVVAVSLSVAISLRNIPIPPFQIAAQAGADTRSDDYHYIRILLSEIIVGTSVLTTPRSSGPGPLHQDEVDCRVEPGAASADSGSNRQRAG